jgi:hypothetical protein
VSLTPRPNGDRTEEVIVAQQILQTMGLRSFRRSDGLAVRQNHEHSLQEWPNTPDLYSRTDATWKETCGVKN